MKKLALVFLALAVAPSAASADASPLRQKQYTEAQDICAAHGIGRTAGQLYWYCVNSYLSRYRWAAAEHPDGSLQVIAPHQTGYF